MSINNPALSCNFIEYRMSFSPRNQSLKNTLYSWYRIVCITVFLPVFSVQAKDDTYKNEFVNRRSFGFTVQQAIPFYRLPEGKPYYSAGITGVYHQPFFKARRLVNAGIDILPQIWFSKAHITSVELGLNVSLNLNIQLKKTSVLSFHIGSGVHYFGMETERQAEGFTFSDNFYLTYKHLVTMKNKKKIGLGFMTGFRHLSNLNVKRPNTGIDSILLGFCFDRIF
ncbi:MAG: acyloxyacyl hydrolase [Sphingobacteriales bacterium]|nr:acyloxyacyl hydrolase [Sphingobacteriales bacterium]